MQSSKLKFLALAAAATILAGGQPAIAASLSFESDGKGTSGAVAGEMPLARLSGITVPRGRLSVDGSTLELSIIPEWQFDRKTALTGTVLQTDAAVAAKTATISGVVYFQSGEWIKYIDDTTAPDLLTLSNGVVRGRIDSFTETDAVLKLDDGSMRNVPLADISAIKSPRAFTFRIPAHATQTLQAGTSFKADASDIYFTPTGKFYRGRALKAELNRNSDGDVSTAKLVAIGMGMSLIELGQLAPILAVPLGQGPLRRAAFFEQYPFNHMNSGN